MPTCVVKQSVLHFPRMRKLATLEFDRDRKSMGVICAPGAAPAVSRESHAKANGPVTRRAARAGTNGGGGGGGGGGAGGNLLLVKGAAETLLARCDKVCFRMRVGHAPAIKWS